MKEYDYKRKIVSIVGYKMVTIKIGNTYTVRIPTGRNEKDKKMFDALIYHNQMTLYAQTREQLISKVRKWIKDYRSKK